MDDRSLEIRVGAFSLLALAGAFAVFWLLRGVVSGGIDGIPLVVDLAETAGLSDGAPVRLAGVSVGRIEQLELLPTRRDAAGEILPVRLQVRLQARLRQALTQGTRFDVGSNSPLGEPFLEVVPGPPGPLLPDGTVIRGEDPPRLDRLLSHVGKLVGGLADQAASDPTRLHALLTHLDSFIADSDGALRDIRPGAMKVLGDADTLTTEALAMIGEVRPLLADLRRDTPGLLAHLDAIATKADALTSKLDPADVVAMRATLKEAQTATQKLNTMADRADHILAAIDNGDGTVGMAIKDPKLFQDLKDMVADLKAHPWRVLWKQ